MGGDIQCAGPVGCDAVWSSFWLERAQAALPRALGTL